MQVQVHRNYIFLQEIEEQGSSKIILPPIFRREMQTVRRGKVLHCGPQSHVSVGETVVYDKWVNTNLEINGQKITVIQPHAVIAVEA